MQRFHFMHRWIAALSVLFLAQGLAPESHGQVSAGAAYNPSVLPVATNDRTGTIVWLDPATMNFVCRGEGGSRDYWVTRATRLFAGRANASFFDLAPGRHVEVISHRSGRFEIADVIRF